MPLQKRLWTMGGAWLEQAVKRRAPASRPGAARRSIRPPGGTRRGYRSACQRTSGVLQRPKGGLAGR
jgi:hypothetical protein